MLHIGICDECATLWRVEQVDNGVKVTPCMCVKESNND